ncbi:signal recognition particle-docking protein FtsY [Methanobrevibacter filiformis]|uniref:Signal recognition particle receptor FtsY n=1 Tax=Methanobrevibacter filiformis TaxID=55758 RepID=A0A166E2R4_9EURY|nr:signal recognition particle-docking protein FtsY [Methanobrevibacter filiformis]KZX16215.1 signal recognition particle receptor FtsY [Methanobrevibacter filiformis]
MFDSLKKKFNNVAGKLTKKVSKEAEEENNVEIVQKTPNLELDKQNESIDNTKEIANDNLDDSYDSKTKDSKDVDFEAEEEISEDKLDIVESKEEVKNESKNSNTEEHIDNSESKESKNRFNFFKRKSKDDADKVDESKDKIGKTEESKEKSKDKVDESKDKQDDEKIPKKKKSGFLSFIKEKTISQKDVEDILWELEMSLLEGDVAMDVASAVVESVKEDLVGTKIKRSNDISEVTFKALRNAVAKIITIDGENMTKLLEEKKAKGEPLIVMFVGINGTGKTTTIAKLANYYLKKGYTPVVAASDTFRAGAIEQINHHTDKLGIKIIKHQKGSDPAAVAFDAVEHAKAKDKELVLIDTAGRMQTNTNLMDEMKKIKRVSKPDLVIFVGDALTGNDAVEQATKFNNAIDIDGVILTKADADSKGGASLSIGYVINKPIMFLGMGQGYDDIIEYDPNWMLDQLFS